MFSRRSIPGFFAWLALFVCSQAPAASDPSPWLEVHSTHFTVITDAGVKKGQEVALRFEQMRAVFALLLTKTRLNQSIPLTVLAFGNDQSYYQLAPLHDGKPIDVPGFFLPGADQEFIALNLSEEESWRAVAHDFSRMLLDFNYPPAQPWFDDGLTEYFSAVRVSDRQYEIGADPGGSTAKSLTAVLNAQPWLPLPELFSAKHDAAAAAPSIYSAESWIVMHYLLHEQKLPETGTYFGLVLNQHLPVEDAIQKAYGMSSAQLQQAVKNYFQARQSAAPSGPAAQANSASPALAEHFPALVAPGDSTITTRPLTESDARAIYAGVQVRVPERRDVALKTLHQLATTPTLADKKSEAKATRRAGEDADYLPSNAEGNEVAHRALAWDHIEHNEFDEAFAEIGDAIALNPGDMWARYYFDIAKYRSAQARHAEMTGIANVMIDLKNVLEWNPEMSAAYDLLAVARNQGGVATAAMESERAAIRLSPRDQSYSFHLAQIYVTSKKWEAADTLLDRLKAGNDPKIAAEAAELQTQAGTQRKYGIPGNGSNAQPRYEAQKTPFDVLDEDAAKRAAAEEASGKVAGGSVEKPVTKFVKGRLVSVDCSKAPAAILTVHSDAGTLRLHSNDYRSLLLIGTDDFSCGWRDVQVTVNYKPSAGGEGDLVSLEMR
jgi:hypothetical protein